MASLQRGLRSKAAPFVVIGILAVVISSIAQPPASLSRLLIDLAIALAAGITLLLLEYTSHGRLGIIVPLGFILIIAFLRNEFGGGTSGFAPLLVLPVAWVALYRSRLDSLITLLFLGAALATPIIIYGAPEYPEGDLRRAISLVLVALLLTIIIRVGRGAATTDPLTGLGNRRLWEQAFEQQLSRTHRRQEPFAAAVIDLDDLKGFNDRYGHVACDHFLSDCARRWQKETRPEDTLVRAGGDEFFLMLPAIKSEREARQVVERLRSVTPQQQTFSAGIAMWQSGDDYDEIMSRADQALYAAKEAGRNRLAVASNKPVHLLYCPTVSRAG